MSDRFSTPEWSVDEWVGAWHIGVGQAYRCHECDNLVLVVKGGTGTLEPRCHGAPMGLVEKKP